MNDIKYFRIIDVSQLRMIIAYNTIQNSFAPIMFEMLDQYHLKLLQQINSGERYCLQWLSKAEFNRERRVIRIDFIDCPLFLKCMWTYIIGNINLF